MGGRTGLDTTGHHAAGHHVTGSDVLLLVIGILILAAQFLYAVSRGWPTRDRKDR